MCCFLKGIRQPSFHAALWGVNVSCALWALKSQQGHMAVLQTFIVNLIAHVLASVIRVTVGSINSPPLPPLYPSLPPPEWESTEVAQPKRTVKITGKKPCSSPINSIANFQFITVVLHFLQGYPEFNFLTSEPTLREINVPKSKCLSIKQPM